MSKQPPAELATEQSAEIGRWMAAIDAAHTTAIFKADYATIAHLHRKLAGVMREYQKFKVKQEAPSSPVLERAEKLKSTSTSANEGAYEWGIATHTGLTKGGEAEPE